MTQIQASSHRRRPSGYLGGCHPQTDTLMGLCRHIDTHAGVGKRRNRRSNGRHVMLVQWRDIELRALTKMLIVLGYRVTSAEDCSKALLYLRREPCEVVISELDMPGLNGFQLARCVRNYSPRTHILLMTARCQAEVTDYMDRRVVDGWLFKPFRMDVFNDMLQNVLDPE
jgi:two-component system capsular synthesis sensor histidine kinase RcsC